MCDFIMGLSIFLVLFGVACLIWLIGKVIECSEYGCWTEIIAPIVCIFVVTAIFIPCMKYTSSFDRTEEDYIVWETRLIAIGDKSNIEGHIAGNIFIMSGRVNEVEYYVGLEMTDKGLHQFKIPAKTSYINESNTETPRVEAYGKRYKNERTRNAISRSISTEYYKIYVPNGTAPRDFRIDLK